MLAKQMLLQISPDVQDMLIEKYEVIHVIFFFFFCILLFLFAIYSCDGFHKNCTIISEKLVFEFVSIKSIYIVLYSCTINMAY